MTKLSRASLACGTIAIIIGAGIAWGPGGCILGLGTQLIILALVNWP